MLVVFWVLEGLYAGAGDKFLNFKAETIELIKSGFASDSAKL